MTSSPIPQTPKPNPFRFFFIAFEHADRTDINKWDIKSLASLGDVLGAESIGVISCSGIFLAEVNIG